MRVKNNGTTADSVSLESTAFLGDRSNGNNGNDTPHNGTENIMDHLIVAESGFFSFREHGLLS